MATETKRWSRARLLGASAGVLALALVPLACGDGDGAGDGGAAPETTASSVIDPGDGGDYAPDLDARSVVDRIDNEYLPYLPGSRWVYEGVSDGERERIEVTVLDERREVMGIDAVVVRDTVTVDGELVEDTRDWFTQDDEGNVWYLGEETAEYEDGEVVSTEGSWEAGVDGALPGIVMQADPEPGTAYRQEYDEGEAEDVARVERTGETVTVAGQEHTDVVVIREWNPFEPEVVEDKSYAPGVGTILEEQVAGGDDRVELIEHTPGPTG